MDWLSVTTMVEVAFGVWGVDDQHDTIRYKLVMTMVCYPFFGILGILLLFQLLPPRLQGHNVHHFGNNTNRLIK